MRAGMAGIDLGLEVIKQLHKNHLDGLLIGVDSQLEACLCCLFDEAILWTILVCFIS
jgi:hypothetical protein